MADLTPNLSLTKPTISENIDLATFNANMDKIDAALGAPSGEITDLLALYNGFSTPWVETTPVIGGMTLASGATNKLQIARHGKLVLGRYIMNTSSYTSTGALTVQLPDDLWSKQGDIPWTVGTFGISQGGSGKSCGGNVILQATSDGQKSKLQFSATVTLNTSTGPWSILVGVTTPAFWVTTVQTQMQAEFFYEAP